MSQELTFKEISNHLIQDERPSVYIRERLLNSSYDFELKEKLLKLEKIEQNPKYHPEGNVLNHVMLVLDNAAKIKKLSNDRLAFMWAALLHDIGKLTTTKVRKGRITSYNHDIEGEKISKQILDKLTDDKDLKYKVSKLVRYHMQPLFFDKNLPFFSYKDMLNEVDYNEVALISMADRLGRGNITSEIKGKELENLEKFKAYLKTREEK
ncbi:HD domain-containing protein [Paraclostridium ghonii]|uniref:Nucleotidyltransferase with HDIG domain n=1 Tax=Paraclostridium ghonii TaxID=29358 RepID=A0ABU0N1L2_9FIRM|nr:HD domain-containing protein [Paeniclostridium ghonii]MDQ0557057.1 putative nucleotidyltransferase with HDIG domain [Paeniclostridium ghonii]